MTTSPQAGTPTVRSVEIKVGTRTLEGVLSLPARAVGVVAFAHGSGSGRNSPRNRLVAAALQKSGVATLLLDLLGEAEAEDRANVFDIGLLAARLTTAADWLASEPATSKLPLGYFGASTGTAAALTAVARQPGRASAVVSRGGRPDLAWDDLPAVQIPTLLIVGGRDIEVLELNRRALARLGGSKQLVVVPGATHLFPESGTLEEVARLAILWFAQWLAAGTHTRTGPA